MKNRQLIRRYAICFAFLLPVFALAAERTDFKVNTDASSAEQNTPRIAVAPDGSFVITWVDWREGTSDIYFQQFDTSGQSVGPNRKVNDEASASYQFDPAIAMDRTSAVSFVWKDYRNNSYPLGADVYLQSFTPALVKSGTNQDISVEPPDSAHEAPDIAIGQWGTGMVVWADYRNLNWDIYGQIVTPNGTLIGGNFRINDDQGTMPQSAPRIAVSRNGWYVVVWTDQRLSNYDIFAQRFDSTGHKLGSNIKINADNGTLRQAFPDVATDGMGHFTVVWVDWRNGTYPANPDIYLSKLDTNLVSLTGNVRVNADVTTLAQRDPAISADRLGNIAIVWSDSTSSLAKSWEVMGQMIDVDGVIRESNFTANTNSDSAQLKPDVALDGRYRYITWVDKRNGNFDIYAAVHQYHDPRLMATPPTLSFLMDKGGALPVSQSVVVAHTGYNRLQFSISTDVSWLSVSPISGESPDTLTVSVNANSLDYGEHAAIIHVTALDSPDEGTDISVRLRIAPPELTLSSDTISFHLIPFSHDTAQTSVELTNTGAGVLNWLVSESTDWLSLSQTSGTAPSTITISASADSLAAGTYSAPIEFVSPGATNSPDTLWCILNVDAIYPIISVNPSTLMIKTIHPPLVDSTFTISNSGLGALNWQATTTAPYLVLTPSSGLNDGLVHITTTNFPNQPGVYVDSITVTDAIFSSSKTITVILNYVEPSSDSIQIGDLDAELEETSTIPITIKLTQDVSRIRLFAQYDDNFLSPEQFTKDANLPSYISSSFAVDSNAHRFTLIMQATDSLLPAGQWRLGDIAVSTGTQVGVSTITTVDIDTLYTDLLTGTDRRVAPVVTAGTATIDRSTPVTHTDPPALPTKFALLQNYPNPFNLTTVIPFSLPSKGHCRLEVFNILGSKVTTLVDQELSAGEYSFTWTGTLESGRIAPSGIYFYRLQSESGTDVRKMVLLK